MKNVEYIITLRDQFTKNLKNINKNLQDTNKNSSALAQNLRSLAPLLGFAGVAMGIKGVVQLGIEMEQTRVAFTTFLKDGEKANKLIADLNQFANITPFNNQEVIKSGRMLLAAQIPLEKIQGTLKTIGDVSAGSNIPLTEMAAIYAKGMNKGRLQAEELNQLAERSVPILQTFSDMFGITTAEVMKMGSEGKITSDLMAKAFGVMTSEGGTFFNLMEKQSATLGGKISTIRGKFELLGANLGENNGVLKEYADRVIKLVDVLVKNQDVIENLIKLTVKAIKIYVLYKTIMYATSRAIKIAMIANKLFRFSIIASNRGLKSAIRLTKTFNATMRGNAIGLAITGITLLITKLIQLRNKQKDATDQQKLLNEQLEKPALIALEEKVSKMLKSLGILTKNEFGIDVLNLDLKSINKFREVIKNFGIDELNASADIFNEQIAEMKRSVENIKMSDVPDFVKESNIKDIKPYINIYDGLLKNINNQIKLFDKHSKDGLSTNNTINETVKETTITSRSPKVINITFGKMVETLSVNTQNLTESLPQIQRMITEVLLNATNDAQRSLKAG